VVLLDVKGASVTVKGVVSLSLVVVGVGGFVVVVGGAADVVVVVGACVELVLTKVVASGIASVVSLLGRTDVEVGVGLEEVEEEVELGLAVDGVAGCVIVCEGFFSVLASDGFSLIEEPPMISEEMGILTTKGSSSFRPLLLLPLGLSVLLCLFT